MKGVTYLLDMFFFIALTIVTILFLVAVFFVNKTIGESITIEHNIELLYEDTSNEDVLLSFLETTNSCGIRMRDAIVEASYQIDNLKEVYMKGCIIDISSSSSLILDVLTDKPYRLSLMKDGVETVLAESGKITNRYEFSEVKFITPKGEFNLMLYSG